MKGDLDHVGAAGPEEQSKEGEPCGRRPHQMSEGCGRSHLQNHLQIWATCQLMPCDSNKLRITNVLIDAPTCWRSVRERVAGWGSGRVCAISRGRWVRVGPVGHRGAFPEPGHDWLPSWCCHTQRNRQKMMSRFVGRKVIPVQQTTKFNPVCRLGTHIHASTCVFCLFFCQGSLTFLNLRATSWATTLLKSPEITHFVIQPQVIQDDWRYWSM